MAVYGYYINLDERGEFYADVRDTSGETVFEIHANSEDQGIFEDGFMAHKNDLTGLTDHLIDLGVIPKGSDIMSMSDFENRAESFEP